MASIIKASINLSEIPKDKIYVGKKGKYLPITITLNDEVDQFGNQGPVIISQSKEEREMKLVIKQEKKELKIKNKKTKKLSISMRGIQ